MWDHHATNRLNHEQQERESGHYRPAKYWPSTVHQWGLLLLAHLSDQVWRQNTLEQVGLLVTAAFSSAHTSLAFFLRR